MKNKKLEKIIKGVIIGSMLWLSAEGVCYVQMERHERKASECLTKAVDSFLEGRVVESKQYRDAWREHRESSEYWETVAKTINPFYHLSKLKK